jgi:hypothetical protein
VARALAVYNKYLAGEYEKIAATPNVSDFISQAALENYQTLSAGGSQLHVALAQTFASLRQPGSV